MNDVNSLKFNLLKSFSLPEEKVRNIFLGNTRTNYQNSFLVTVADKEIEYKEVKFVDKQELYNNITLIFVELEFSSKYENRYFYEYSINDYGNSWLILDNDLIHNHLYDIRNTIYLQRTKRKTFLNVKRQTI